MAILDINYYYYFRVNNGNPYGIKVSIIEINTEIMHNFKRMTEEQKMFYLEHPNASVQEVWKCELNPPYVPPTPDLKEYIELKVKELQDKCYAYVSKTSLIVVMALDKVENIAADSFFSLPEAQQIMADFRTESKHAMTVLSTYKSRIEAAQSVESVDSIYNEAISKL